MCRIYVLCMVMFFSTAVFAQKNMAINATLLTATEASALLRTPIKTNLNIVLPVFRIYNFIDKTGKYYLILTESKSSLNEKAEVQSDKLRAVMVKDDFGNLNKIMEINDHILTKDFEESSIWFWTKYIDFTDYDLDGVADPIVVYGSAGPNNYSDGRIKMIIYYKGQKVLIRHKNGILDSERQTQVDQAFYKLPLVLQNAVKKKMILIMNNDHGIFPNGWEMNMKKQKTFFSER